MIDNNLWLIAVSHCKSKQHGKLVCAVGRISMLGDTLSPLSKNAVSCSDTQREKSTVRHKNENFRLQPKTFSSLLITINIDTHTLYKIGREGKAYQDTRLS